MPEKGTCHVDVPAGNVIVTVPPLLELELDEDELELLEELLDDELELLLEELLDDELLDDELLDDVLEVEVLEVDVLDVDDVLVVALLDDDPAPPSPPAPLELVEDAVVDDASEPPPDELVAVGPVELVVNSVP